MTARSVRILVISAAFLAGLVSVLRGCSGGEQSDVDAGRPADRRRRGPVQAH